MTTNEIKAIIAEKIAGQGNQVDIGNGLAEVLNALADAIPSETAIVKKIRSLRPQMFFNFSNTDSIAEFNQWNNTNFGSFEELKNYIAVRIETSSDWADLRFEVGDNGGYFYLNYFYSSTEMLLLMGGYYGSDSGEGAIIRIENNRISVTFEEI